MKKVAKLLIISSLIMPSLLVTCLARYSVAESWRRVVGQGFGITSNDYAWSMATFKGKLYVGTLNSLNGAEIWSSSSGMPGKWQRVYKSMNRFSWGVRYLYADGDRALYACIFNILGAMILKSEDGHRWTTVAKGGLGNRNNYTIRCMVRFGDYLYAGAGSNEAQIYRSKDGSNWELLKTKPGFGSTKVMDLLTDTLVNNNVMIGELAIFHNKLYAFTWTGDFNIQSLRITTTRSQHLQDKTHGQIMDQDEDQDKTHGQIMDYGSLSIDPSQFLSQTPGAFEVWRSSNGINWEKVVGQSDAYGNGMGFCLHDPQNLANDVVASTTVFQKQLYLGTESASSNSSIWRTKDGTHWEKVLDFFELGEKFNHYVWRMIPFNGRLFIGTFNVGPKLMAGVTGAQVWVSDSGDADSFYNFVHNGFDGESIYISRLEIPKNYGLRSFGILNGHLFAGTATMLSIMAPDQGMGIAGDNVGCEIWELVPFP